MIGAGLTSVLCMLALQAQERRASNPPPAKSAAAPKDKGAQAPTQPVAASPSASAEKVAFTFADEAQMQEFGKIWQQRQIMMTRMAVLRSYWDQEQAAVAQINQGLLSKYSLDVNKNYNLDTKRRALIEQPATATQVPPMSSDAAPASAPESAAKP